MGDLEHGRWSIAARALLLAHGGPGALSLGHGAPGEWSLAHGQWTMVAGQGHFSNFKLNRGQTRKYGNFQGHLSNFPLID